ncbi:putative protein MJ0308 [Methanothermobacter wolfeii]|uniref:DUF169 domain-containing protein n=1 Tax=Methanothermobacter wolfeii TaxID=145261 RepID=A0A9E7RWK2_METWO|nr:MULTISPECIES: DUF169 domain-containing protein [Methanothermobacter]NLM02393.1 DUF169 domain-containing protein [Methanothermobacter wolfeii]QHN06361.1 hypothetical protein FZP57_04280 [Methanothermobacter sp. THM-1]UXH32563.1 DUF169 domain-containing protein [Methanothermobacter wolfeii]SCM57115.1 putative protein MJ0308 [Methanothermobacter wolfeii]
MADECQVNGYDVISEKFRTLLGLEKSPVAVKLVLREEDLPEGIEKIDKPARHCEMVQMAAAGESFYAPADSQACKGGADALGIDEAPAKVKTGEFYYQLGRFASFASAKRTFDEIPSIDLKFYAAVYAPLEKATFDPDVIVIICNPAQAMKISQALLYTLGGRVEADFSGIQSICADAVAGPYLRKRPNITMGCSGSRQYAGVRDDELIVGLNGENIGCVVNALEAIS